MPGISAKPASFPAPTGGLNALDALSAMKPNDAVTMTNFFPGTSSVALRQGYALQCDTAQGTHNVATLLEWNGNNGSTKLLAACNGKIIDVTTSTPSTIQTGYTVDIWDFTQHATGAGQFVVAVNGADTAWKYDGTTRTDLAMTLIGGGPFASSNLHHVTAYQGNMIYAQINTLKIWAPATFPGGGVSVINSGAIDGGMASFDFGPIAQRGGSIAGIGTWTRDSGGSNASELFVLVTTRGEAFVYGGSDPFNATGTNPWTKIGQFRIGETVKAGKVLTNIGPDMVLICEDGIQPLAAYLATGESRANSAISFKISTVMNAAIRGNKTLPGWQAFLYPQGTCIIINTPDSNGTSWSQYVVNTVTGAWCKYVNLPAVSWGLLNSNAYFGSTDGKVYQFDTGLSDNGSDIVGEILTAYQVGAGGGNKRFTMARPILQIGSPSLTFAMDIETDYGVKQTPLQPISSNAPTGGLWGTGVWGTMIWGSNTNRLQNRWVSVSNIGYAAAAHLKVSTKSCPVSVLAFDVLYEQGLYV